MKNKRPLISICCITYNQENYISNAIESFFNQVNFDDCEILIHDDASTDNTVEIIKKYQKQYPTNTIRLFEEKINQYSLGNHEIISILFKEAQGEYIALCEGDDYWINPQKLMKQLEVLKKNEMYSMCFHATLIYDCKKRKYCNSRHIYSHSCDVPISAIIEGGGGFIPTASIFCRKKDVVNLPEFYHEAPVGDYPLQLILASKGKVYYIDEPMSVYRINTENSLTRFIGANDDNASNLYRGISKMLKNYSSYTQGKYAGILNPCINKYEYLALCTEKKLNKILMNPYNNFFFSESIIKKMAIIIKCLMPKLYINMKKILYKIMKI